MEKISALIFIVMLVISCGSGGSAVGSGNTPAGAPTGNLKSQVDLVGTT